MNYALKCDGKTICLCDTKEQAASVIRHERRQYEFSHHEPDEREYEIALHEPQRRTEPLPDWYIAGWHVHNGQGGYSVKCYYPPSVDECDRFMAESPTQNRVEYSTCNGRLLATVTYF